MAIEFNFYKVTNKIKDTMRFLNEDFAKIKTSIDAGAGGGGGGNLIEFHNFLPAPSVEFKGRLIYLYGLNNESDTVYVCKKIADNSYIWYQVA